MTAPLQSITNMLGETVNSLESMANALETPVDLDLGKSKEVLNVVQNELDALRENVGKGFPDIELPDIPVPEPIPITWDVQEIDVFKNTGIERFQSEISSTNGYLDRLNETQIQIGRTAAGMDIIPDDAYMDIKNMTSRIGDIRAEIELLERNPMNLNVDQVNNQLETLRTSLSNAERQQNDLNDAMQRMDAGDIQSSYNELNRTISNSERHLRDNFNAQQKFTQEVENSNNSANRLNGTFMKIAGTIAAAFSIKQIIGLSDEMTNITSRLDLMNDGLQSTVELQDMIFKSAQRSRGTYLDTADAVASLGGNAKDAFQNTQEIVHFSELLNKQFTIAGTSAEGVSAATLQLTQAMGMGVLRGEELNSVLEQAPNIVQAIADYLDEPIGKIKDLASEGLITSEVVKNAMFSAADEINAKFEQMPMTFAQIWTSFKNQALMSFQPVLQRLNDIANSQAFQTFVSNAIQWVSILAHVVTIAFEKMASLGQFVADHWGMIAPVVWGVITALGIYLGYLTISNTLTAISTGIQTAQAIALAVKTGTTVAAAAATHGLTVAQWALNTAMLANPITWVVIAIIALVVIIYTAIAAINHFTGASISATGLIAGAFAWLGMLIINIFIAIINTGIIVVNLLVNVFQVGVWAIQMAVIGLGLIFVLILDAILNTGILVINLLVNAWNIGVWTLQMFFIGLIILILLIFDGILNSGIILIELLVNAWNLGIFGLQMLWIGLNVLVRIVLQGILNFGISVAEGFANAWNDAIYGLQMAFYKFQTFVSKVMQMVGQGSLGVVNSVLSGISTLVNSAISGLNTMINMANKIPGVNIGTIGTVDLKVGGGAQSVINSIGSGLVAPVRAERVSLNRSTVGQDYMDNVSVPSAPTMTKFERKSLASDFLGSIDIPKFPTLENTFEYQNNTSDFLGSIEMPKFPKLEQTFDTIDFKDMGKAFDAGYEWGEQLEQGIKDFDLKDSIMDWLDMDMPNMDDLIGGGLEDLMDVPGIEEMTGGGLGDQADKATGGSGGANKATGGGLGDKANKATGGSGGANKAAKDLGKIKDNTKDIADDLGITKEDLKYLRDLASRDFVNRYTNNEIVLNFDNTNNVNNEMDLDGVVDYMAKGLEQAVEVTVEGVYP